MPSADAAFFRLILAVLIGATALTGGIAFNIALGASETMQFAALLP